MAENGGNNGNGNGNAAPASSVAQASPTGNNGGNNGNNAGNNNGNNNNNNAQGSNRASGSSSPGASRTASGSSTASGNSTMVSSTSVSIPATAAAGGVDMIQPASSSTSYYKIAQNEYITFQWNLTSLYVQPKTLTVRAYCPDVNLEYPVGPLPTGKNANLSMGGVFSGNTTQVIWSPWEWAQQPNQPPFAAATYNLRIYDERGEKAPSNLGGYLAPYLDRTKFAMYFPQAYTPYANWTCATCSGRISMDSPASFPLLVSIIIMIITAWGLLRRDFA